VKRYLALAALVVGGFFGARALWHALASDETKIRWALEAAVADFNGPLPGYAVSPLAKDWYCRTSGVHRDTLKYALSAFGRQEREGAWILELPPESLSITVAGDAAASAFELELSRERADASEVVWRLAVDAEWRDGDGGWKIASSSYTTLEGRRP